MVMLMGWLGRLAASLMQDATSCAFPPVGNVAVVMAPAMAPALALTLAAGRCWTAVVDAGATLPWPASPPGVVSVAGGIGMSAGAGSAVGGGRGGWPHQPEDDATEPRGCGPCDLPVATRLPERERTPRSAGRDGPALLSL